MGWQAAAVTVTFRTTVLLGGATATGLPVPDDALAALGAGRRPAVTVTLPGHTYRSTVGARDGVALVPLSAAHREAAGLAAGDEVEVTLALDTAPRVVEVPADLAAALEAAPGARAAFDALSPSARSRHVLSVEGARTDATRERRVAKAVAELVAGLAG